MKFIEAIILLFVAASGAFAQSTGNKLEIPAGVNYKLAKDDVNASAKALLEKSLAGDQSAWTQLFSDKAQTCGPMLWQMLKPGADPILQNAKLITIVLTAPTAITTQGRVLLTDEARRLFWTSLLMKYPKLVTARVRKAKANEINYYWATIPFDIEEPFFAVDTGSDVFVVHLRQERSNTTLFWIDLVGDVRSLKPDTPSNDTEKSIVKELSNAAETQSPQTMLRAGKAYLTGDGVTVDIEKGRLLLDGAAQKGELDAQLLLGMSYFSGRYWPQDRTKAASYLKMAAEQGNALAQFYVGMMYLQGAGLEKSAERAIPYLRKAADQNFASAQYNLGAIYFQGLGTAQDKAKACSLYGKAAEQGQLEAINDLAWCYQQGEGVEKDSAKAMTLYLKAAERGHPRSQGNLAMMYIASSEWEKAYVWLRIGENAGGTQARPVLENVKKHLSQAQIDLAELKVTDWEKAHPRKQ